MQHIIELNGRRYDAQTGRQLPQSDSVPAKAPQKNNQQHSIDGFVKKGHHAPRRVANTHIEHHAPAKSSTLMRKAVKKPTPITHLSHHVSQIKEAFFQPSDIVQHQSETPMAPPERLDRAEQIRRSKLIKRFGAEIAHPQTSHNPGHAIKHLELAGVSQPIMEDDNEDDLLLDGAISHTQPKIKKSSLHKRTARKLHLTPRALSVSAAVMTFVVLGGFFAYSNVPNLSMRVAAMRSNVRGNLPGYKPSGFSLNGPIKYQPGEIVVAYKSNSDDRNYQITQKASQWDTESLQNYLNEQKIVFQTVSRNGKTIYLYDDASATWVDSGVLYKLEGQSQLNTDQVLRIASSL